MTMKPASVVMYPVPGVTLHRVASGQRSQGDGEEQAPQKAQSTLESSKATLQPSPMPSRSMKEERMGKENQVASKMETSPPVGRPITQDSRELSDNCLPEIREIASKLTKVSIMSSPDSDLLNAPPKDLHSKKIIPLHPMSCTHSVSSSRTSTRTVRVSGVHSKGKRDPRFVPYEPYKGCVKPIQSMKKRSKSKSKRNNKTEREERGRATIIVDESQSADQKDAEKLSIVVKDFEEEKLSWEKKTSILTDEKKSLEDQLNQMKKDKLNLETQLNVQSQVNTELKKLLVASVGEEVQGRVQCLTEDKARMATMIRRYSEKVDRDYEEKEKIGIQCDVWRSKFLGSSMLVDELVGMKVALSHKLEEAEEALRVLLDEHDVARQHVLNMYRMNKQLREAFDPLAAQSGGLLPLASADLVTLAMDGNVLAETVRDRLLGELGRSLGCNLTLAGLETQTPGEKIARQLVCQLEGPESSGAGKSECSTVCPGRPAMLHRYHPNTRYEHVTVNCCAYCNGEIKVV